MILLNNTNMRDADILRVSTWVGIESSLDSVLSVSVDNGMVDHGEHKAVMHKGKVYHFIKIKHEGDVKTLAHELRHVYQCETLGLEVFNALYEIESSIEGYKENVFEIDARGYEGEAA